MILIRWILKKIYIITFGGGVWHGPAKGDEQMPQRI